MKEISHSNIALDGGTLIALSIGEKGSSILKERILLGEITGFASQLAITEMLYILCRKFSWKIAVEKKQQIMDSKMVIIINNEELIEEAAKYKCNRAIALADCFTLATAKLKDAKAMFAKREEELIKEINKQKFDVEIEFLLSD